MALNNMPSAKQ
jgi:hypothetical protein